MAHAGRAGRRKRHAGRAAQRSERRAAHGGARRLGGAMSDLIHHFGATVRKLREARTWSQEQLAEHAGLNRSYVGEIERGEAIASIVTADKIARAFDVSISTLLPGAYVT
ncbi:Helix-turn-helix protein [Burkholderia cenocepacia PC184]|nr:Helix-turn-helix protein [Burkholderia cenocepacia PC184]